MHPQGIRQDLQEVEVHILDDKTQSLGKVLLKLFAFKLFDGEQITAIKMVSLIKFFHSRVF